MYAYVLPVASLPIPTCLRTLRLARIELLLESLARLFGCPFDRRFADFQTGHGLQRLLTGFAETGEYASLRNDLGSSRRQRALRESQGSIPRLL